MSRSLRVSPDDVPDRVFGVLPGIEYQTVLDLAPLDAPATVRRLQLRTANTLARAAHGLVFDPQEQTVVVPRGVTRLVQGPATQACASMLSLSWWFANGPLFDGIVSPLLDTVLTVLPEAMPRRYGLSEPPAHRYADTGRLQFESFVRRYLDFVPVWYPHRPVVGVHLSVPPQAGWTEAGASIRFRCGYLRIDLLSEVLSQPGWETGLRTAWHRISQVVRPFYGDVRTLRGYALARGTYFVGPDAESHPLSTGWWMGLPPGPACAIVLGEPYPSEWPAFAAVAEQKDGLSFVSTGSWASGEDALAAVGNPPPELSQVQTHPGKYRQYPDKWPFAPDPAL